jgi:hypothetical protein
MSVSQTQDHPYTTNEYEEKLARAIARHEELLEQMQKLISSWEGERSQLKTSWEIERSQLKTKIVQLEHSLVDVIERSNNPLRAVLLSEEKMRVVEEAKREWTAQWEAERNQLLAELNRLRSSKSTR